MKRLILSLSMFLSAILPLTAMAQNPPAPRLVVQTGHTSTVSAVAFSPDGSLLASGSADTTIKLWQVGTRRELRTLIGHDDEIYTVVFSPDGRTLASGSKDKTIKIWDAATGQVLKTLTGLDTSVSLLAFSPDGSLIASEGRGDKTINLWDVKTGKVLKILPGHSQFLRTLAFSPDGRTLASGSVDMTVKLWNVATGKLTRTLSGHKNSVLSVAFSPDGKTLASGGMDGAVKIWNTADGRPIKTFVAHDGDVNAVMFAPDGKTLASGGTDDSIKIWNAATGTAQRTIKTENGVSALALSPDGRTLASGSTIISNAVDLWNTGDGTPAGSLAGSGIPVNSLAVSADGRTLFRGGDEEAAIWDFEKGGEIRRLAGGSESAGISADGKIAAAANIVSEISLYDLAADGRQKNLAKSDDSFGKQIALSADGQTLLGSKKDSPVTWDVESGKIRRTFEAAGEDIRSVALSPDGRLAAGSRDDGKITVWNVESGRQVKTLTGDADFSPYNLAFSPDGQTLACVDGGEQKHINLWNLETGIRKTLAGHKDYLYHLAFSADGSLLASGGAFTFKLWNVAEGREIKSFKTNGGVIAGLAFLPHTGFLLTGSSDTTVKIWSPASDAPLATLISLGRGDWVVTTPDGRFDTSKNLAQLTEIHWVMPDKPFETIVSEELARRSYTPGLLRKITNFKLRITN